jgi:hypothetical protein
MTAFTLPVTLRLEDNKPQVKLSEVNGMPLLWIGDNLSQGINSGIDEAFKTAPIDVTSLKVNEQAIDLDIAKSGRVAWAPPTPVPGATPTPTPEPTSTPTGLALLAVFNDLDHPLILEIQGQSWTIPAQDTKVIEQPTGTYTYTVRYAENGQLAAQGSRTWDYRAYRWRIGVNGESIE